MFGGVPLKLGGYINKCGYYQSAVNNGENTVLVMCRFGYLGIGIGIEAVFDLVKKKVKRGTIMLDFQTPKS